MKASFTALSNEKIARPPIMTPTVDQQASQSRNECADDIMQLFCCCGSQSKGGNGNDFGKG